MLVISAGNRKGAKGELGEGGQSAREGEIVGEGFSKEWTDLGFEYPVFDVYKCENQIFCVSLVPQL